MAHCNLVSNDFYCTCCGNKGINIYRKVAKQRKNGHLKKLFCITCQKETNHAEVKFCTNYTYEDFKKEFELGRFVEGNRIPITDLKDCGSKECKYNVEGKCWNYLKGQNCDETPEV